MPDVANEVGFDQSVDPPELFVTHQHMELIAGVPNYLVTLAKKEFRFGRQYRLLLRRQCRVILLKALHRFGDLKFRILGVFPVLESDRIQVEDLLRAQTEF